MRNPWLWGVACAVCVVAGASRTRGATAPLEIVACPSVALYGEPFSWKVVGLPPGGAVTVRATSRDARRTLWESQADFRADPAGVVDIASDVPVAGAYAEADIFGLLWSMKPAGGKGKPVEYRENATSGWTVDLAAVDSTGRAARAQFRCVYQRPGEALVRVPLEEDGLRGVLYRPARGGPVPGLIVLGGSEGGLFEPRARALASNGFATLTLAYFGFPGLPDELVEIPLETVERAIAWLKRQPGVRGDRLALAGGSKGAELALLAASRSRDVRAVVAWTPTSHAWEGHTMKFFDPDYRPVASWSVGGRAVPYLPFEVSAEEKAKEQAGTLDSFVEFFRRSLAHADPADLERAAIPVERVSGAILLVSGTDDRIWPAEEACATIAARLRRANFPHEVRHLSIPGGGHESCVPALITADRGQLIDGDPSGGSPRADARGGYRSWAEALEFLHRHLDP